MKSKTHYLALSVRASLPVRMILEALMFDYGCSGIEERTDGFLAVFPEGVSRQNLLEILDIGNERIRASGISTVPEIAVEEIPDRDWSVQWKDRFLPVEAGEKIIIRAPWHPGTTEKVEIIIEPSMAFGTGEHPTTRLCLEAVEQCAAYPQADSLLDIGTGTGILAIAAKKLGFRHVTAIDSDPVAVEIARENTRKNNVPEIIVSASPLNTVPGPFNVIVGNLTSEAIKALLGDCMERLSRGGTCIFSGILREQKDDMLSFFREEGILKITVVEREGWCAMVFQS